MNLVLKASLALILFSLAASASTQPVGRDTGGERYKSAKLVGSDDFTFDDIRLRVRLYRLKYNRSGTSYQYSCELLDPDFSRYGSITVKTNGTGADGVLPGDYRTERFTASRNGEIWCGPTGLKGPVALTHLKAEGSGCGRVGGAMQTPSFDAYGRFCGRELIDGVRIFSDGRTELREPVGGSIRSIMTAPDGTLTFKHFARESSSHGAGPQTGAEILFAPGAQEGKYEAYEDGKMATARLTESAIARRLEDANEAELTEAGEPFNKQIERLEDEQESVLGPNGSIADLSSSFEENSLGDRCYCTFNACLESYSANSNQSEVRARHAAMDRLCRAMFSGIGWSSEYRNRPFLDVLRELEANDIQGGSEQAARVRQARLDLDRAEAALQEANRLRDERDRELAEIRRAQAAEETERKAAVRERLARDRREYAQRLKEGHEKWLQCLADNGYDLKNVDQLKAVTQNC